MAHWVKCTSAEGQERPIFVNLDQAVSVVESHQGTTIHFTEGSHQVTETARQIFALATIL